MPLYRGSKTRVSLVTASLTSTTTDTPTVTQSSETTRVTDQSESALKYGRRLTETYIPLGGDAIPLHFLGERGDMPFKMVRAGKELRQDAADQKRIFHQNPVRNAIYAKFRRPDPSEAITSPQALAVLIELSQQSFVPTIKPVMDIKVDVLFNGEFSHSTLWPSSLRKCEDPGTKVLSGLQTHTRLEHAWVILPCDQEPDCLQRASMPSTETTEQRWAQIAASLAAEADARGRDLRGNRTVVGEYFNAISMLPSPPELETWLESKGQKFGVVDVVLSYGSGRKDMGSQVIRLPTRMKNPGFRLPGLGKSLTDEAKVNKDTPNKDTSELSLTKNGDTISSSHPLPKYIAKAVTEAGFVVHNPLTAGAAGSPSAVDDETSPRNPSDESNEPVGHTAVHITPIRSTAAFTSSPNLGTHDTGTSGSSSSSILSSPELAQLTSEPGRLDRSSSSATSESPQEDLSDSQSPSRTMLPPQNTRMFLPRHSPISPPGASPVKKRRRTLALRLKPKDSSFADIGTPESSVGTTSRGTSNSAGSPRDSSTQDTDFSGENVNAEQTYRPVGSRDQDPAAAPLLPPISPLTSPPKSRPAPAKRVSKRLVLKKSGRVFHTRDVKMPFRLVMSPVKPPAQICGAQASILPGSENWYARRRKKKADDEVAKIELELRQFVTPELSRDCAITYAQPDPELQGPWKPGMARGFGGGVVRQVKIERDGDFEEHSILVGVRFVVV